MLWIIRPGGHRRTSDRPDGEPPGLPWEDVRRRAEAEIRKRWVHPFGSRTRPTPSTDTPGVGMKNAERPP